MCGDVNGDEGGVSLRDAVARGFMAAGTPAHLQSPLGALEAKFKEDVLRSSDRVRGHKSWKMPKDKSESTETLGLGLPRFGG